MRNLLWWMWFLRKNIFYQLFKKTEGRLAMMMNGSPSQQMFIIGVTGTNGKTTTVTLIHHLLQQLVGKSLMISTASVKIGEEEQVNDKKMTSLTHFAFQSLLAHAKDQWCSIAVVEVSSHALDQHRFTGVEFDAAVLTNITPEHLDYHGTMDHYIETKKKLFTNVLTNRKPTKVWVLPKDDVTWKKRFESMSFDQSLNYGVTTSAWMRAENIHVGAEWTEFDIIYLGQRYHVVTKMLGEYNVYNILAALSTVVLTWVSLQSAIDALKDFWWVLGRTKVIKIGGVTYVVDFAHDQSSLEKVLTYLQSLKQTPDNKVITVFGATWMRDTSKRSRMGHVVDNLSDVIVLTDDDALGENRLSIIHQIREGISRQEGDNFFIIPERYFAIQMACDVAQSGDVVLLAWKGHEVGLYTNYGKRKRNDETVLREVLRKKKG